MVFVSFVLEDGLLGCSFRGVPGGSPRSTPGAPDSLATPQLYVPEAQTNEKQPYVYIYWMDSRWTLGVIWALNVSFA